jgi:hypothetical protein
MKSFEFAPGGSRASSSLEAVQKQSGQSLEANRFNIAPPSTNTKTPKNPKLNSKGIMNTPLTEREEKFLTAYFGLADGGPGVDASKAIRAAGYTGTRANQAAYKLLQRPRVAEAVSRRNRARDANIRALMAERDRKEEEDWNRGRAERFARLYRRSSRR